MEPETEKKSEPVIIEYATATPLAPRNSTGIGFAIASILCVVPPILGFAIKSGPLYLAGLPLSIIGLFLGIRGLRRGKSPRVKMLAMLAIFIVSLEGLFFVCLIF